MAAAAPEVEPSDKKEPSEGGAADKMEVDDKGDIMIIKSCVVVGSR